MPNSQKHKRGQMTDHFRIHEFQSLVNVFRSPIIGLNVERLDYAIESVGGLIE